MTAYLAARLVPWRSRWRLDWLCAVCAALSAAGATGAAEPAVLTVRAKTAAIRTAGGPAGEGWNLWTRGRVGAVVRVPADGDYRVVVRAYGTPAGKVWPVMALVVDAAQAKTITVRSATYAEHAFERRLSAGVHEIAVAFLNDAVVGREDRNLYLDRIEIHAPPGAPTVTLAPAKEIAQMAARKETDVLAAARKEIERTRKSDATVQVVDAAGRPVAGAAVAVELTRHDFLFGCNIYMFDRYKTARENEAYKRRFAELLNYATVGFYWRSYEPQRGRPKYDYTDRVVAWCRRHGIRMKGHPLLWGHRAGVPTWSKGQPGEAVRKKRVTDILTRYRGKIELWEVVNEPSHIREPTIDQPYRWARQADANAYLIVNDYYVMANGYEPFFRLLTKAKSDGVPFDGIGIQAHEPRTMRFPLDRVRAVLDKYATLGKELHITEYSPTSGGQKITGSHVKGVWDEQAQADYAVKFYTVCFAHPAVVAITWWDLCDHGSWLKGGGMLRADLSPKPVYEQLRKLIHGTWKTKLRGKTDAHGRWALRGFHGAYTVTVKTPRVSATAKRRLTTRARNQWTVRLEPSTSGQ